MRTEICIKFPPCGEKEEYIISDNDPILGSYRLDLEAIDIADARAFKAISKLFITLCYDHQKGATKKEFDNAAMFMRTACMWAMMGVTKNI
jgi:hypothetical protein